MSARPTPGLWHVDEDDARDGCWFIPIVGEGGEYICEIYGSADDLSISDIDRVNAALIAEAGTVYHETQITPRELADQNADLADQKAELLAALEGVMTILGRAESNASGLPEFDYVGPRVAKARAVIAKCKAGAV